MIIIHVRNRAHHSDMCILMSQTVTVGKHFIFIINVDTEKKKVGATF